MSETAAKKDVQKLQRAIVDGLEDIKGQDIRVFNTEHLSPLFERVIVASGTSNRQTRALATSVRDKVRDAGFAKPRIEGEENGEWIIVDCGVAVVHIMQPTIRQYYNLEEIWGEKPVRLKGPASKAAGNRRAATTPSKEKAAPAPAKKAPAATKKAAPAKKPATKVAAKSPARKAPAKSPARKSAAPRGARGSASSTLQTVVVNKPSARAAAKAAAAQPMGKAPAKAPAKKAPARAAPKAVAKPAARKTAPRTSR